MATTRLQIPNHDFQQFYEKYDEVYEERPYISGGFFFGFGSINTEYRKVLISYKERPVIGICKCGLDEKDPIHAKKIICRADKSEPKYIF
jgi:hypothetical protein